MAKLNLPEGFEITELSAITFNHGEEILGHCYSCAKKSDCKMNYNLRHAMGNDYVHWDAKFVAVDVPTPHKFFKITTQVLCTDYEGPQLRLPKIPRTYSDGVEKLMENLAREKAECAELDREYDKNDFYKLNGFVV